MALGGRPKEEGGHKALKISVDNFVYEALDKVENKSRFIEETLRPILKQFDPGDTCQLLSEIFEKIARETVQATQEAKYDKVAALAALANSLEPYRALCSTCSQSDHSEYPRNVPLNSSFVLRRQDKWISIGVRTLLPVKDEAQEKAAVAEYANLNSHLGKQVKSTCRFRKWDVEQSLTSSFPSSS